MTQTPTQSAGSAQLSLSSLVIAGTILRVREMRRETVRCAECNGTGAQEPDCQTCKGYRSIRLKAAYARGWKKDDLRDIDDGYCECPECDGSICSFCSGGGDVPRHEQAQQERRALIYARYQQIPPLCTLDYYGRRRREYQCLSLEAVAPHLESGSAFRLSSVLGDELYLPDKSQFPALYRAARERAKALRLPSTHTEERGA